ncbi:CapA family protein [Pseudomonas putida]|uniref:CapA family protein n=1 Tax=Pseudomonas putida TaxID=303 RepID=UPI0009A1B082|nr:CapA family protein [Pseudomonas putida]
MSLTLPESGRCEFPCTVTDNFSFAAVGDLIGPTRPETVRIGTRFRDVVDLLKAADVTFANQEGSIFDVDHFEGFRAAENGGGYPVSDAVVADDLKAMGIDVVSKANNHATDWGIEGMNASLSELRRAGVAVAGAGTSLAAARAPAYLETAKGRVAVLAAASTFTPMSPAGNADGEVGARPGISVLRTTPVNVLTAEGMQVVWKAGCLQGIGTGLDSRAHGNPDRLRLGDEVFAVGERSGLRYEMNPHDFKEIVRSIRGAKQVSDFVAFGLHGHESYSGDGVDRRPADFMPILYRAAVDAGADIVVTTGPHLVRGIEIYKGKPIFYGLGSFFLQLEGGRGPTVDAARQLTIDPLEFTKPEYIRKIFQFPVSWYDSVLPVCEFSAGRLSTVKIFPLLLTKTENPGLQGHPRIAVGQDATRILQQLQLDSAEFGTSIVIKGDVGVICL